MGKTFILVTQEAEKLGAKHLPVFFETPCSYTYKHEDGGKKSWFGLIWFGLVGMVQVCLIVEEIFQQENIIVTTPTQLQPQHNLT